MQVSSDQRAARKKLLDKPNFGALNIQLAEKTIVIDGHDVYTTSQGGKRRTNRNPGGPGGMDLQGSAVDRRSPSRLPPQPADHRAAARVGLWLEVQERWLGSLRVTLAATPHRGGVR